MSRVLDYQMIHYLDTMPLAESRLAISLRLATRFAFFFALGCGGTARTVTPAQRAQISAEVEKAMRDAYDLSKPNVAERMLSLYPQTGSIVSAAAGSVISSRDSVASGIRYFWNNVGSNMRSPQWIWERFYVDVLSPTSAVVTATYRIPHRDPQNRPHEIAGAMTEVFEKRGGKWIVLQEHLSDRATAIDSMANMTTHEHQ